MSITIKGLSSLKLPTNNEMAFALASNGKKIAESYYSGENVVVMVEEGQPSKVVSEGTQVRFLEYGTGVTGEGTYQGVLPTETITFESVGEVHSTQGWEYNYPNPKTKKIVNGKEGWYYSKTFTTGQPAQAQMWKTARDLRERKTAIIIETIKNKLGGK